MCTLYISNPCNKKKIETKISVGKWSIFWGWMILDDS